MTADEARKWLGAAGVFYGEDDDDPKSVQTLNMNDTWGWASAWGEYVTDVELPEVADLFWRYGQPGIFYWVSERHEQMRSEFEDINRFVDFVRNEEQVRKDVPDSDKRAYAKIKYLLGG